MENLNIRKLKKIWISIGIGIGISIIFLIILLLETFPVNFTSVGGTNIDSTMATKITHNLKWYNFNKAKREKSIYYEKPKIDALFNDIITYCYTSSRRNNPVCTTLITPGKNTIDTTLLGIRIYFGENEYEYPKNVFKSRPTLVIRATYNGDDIKHFTNEGNGAPYVAMDLGNVCPPDCNVKNSTDQNLYKGGEYDKDGLKYYK